MTVVNSVKWIDIHDIIDNDYNYDCTKEYEDDDVTDVIDSCLDVDCYRLFKGMQLFLPCLFYLTNTCA